MTTTSSTSTRTNTVRPAPIYDGPTPDHLDGFDDRGLQAQADSRTVDLFGGGR